MGVISPLLANIYLHYVLDEWFDEKVKPRMRGDTYLVRFADDFVIGFSHREDAERVQEVLPKRLARYGLTVNEAKTRLVAFQRPPRRAQGKGPGVFDFLGFTHYWARSRRGTWVIKRKTVSSRFHRSLQSIGVWCRDNRHRRIADQHRILAQKVRGHYAYYGITGNGSMLTSFWEGVKRRWHHALARRSHKAYRDWAWFVRLMERYPVPRPTVVHSVYHPQRNPGMRSRMR